MSVLVTGKIENCLGEGHVPTRRLLPRPDRLPNFYGRHALPTPTPANVDGDRVGPIGHARLPIPPVPTIMALLRRCLPCV